jgi:hypothetical protein
MRLDVIIEYRHYKNFDFMHSQPTCHFNIFPAVGRDLWQRSRHVSGPGTGRTTNLLRFLAKARDLFSKNSRSALWLAQLHGAFSLGVGWGSCRDSLARNRNVTKASSYTTTSPIPVAVRSKTWVCGRSIAGIVGLTPAEGTDVRLLCS